MSYFPGDDDDAQEPRGCGCHFEMPGTCPGRSACPMFAPDATDEPPLPVQIAAWVRQADEKALLAFCEFVQDQLDIPDMEMLQNWIRPYLVESSDAPAPQMDPRN